MVSNTNHKASPIPSEMQPYLTQANKPPMTLSIAYTVAILIAADANEPPTNNATMQINIHVM